VDFVVFEIFVIQPVPCTLKKVPMKPTVGITRCSRVDDYVASVEQAGGRARILEVSESPRKLLDEIDGLLLTGGGDIDPVLYGEDRHPTVEDAEPGRDEFEIDLARRAMAADLPLLAICRGVQVLNVAAGGTLIQDIPSAVETDLSHSIQMPKDAVAHPVRVEPGSRLEQALGSHVDGTHMCRVNSRHHQAIGQVGSGMVASATAPDGIIEAVERDSSEFCLGVQWHPENFWRTREFNPLFESFVQAAQRRLDQRIGQLDADG
jgi:putative glutamine amidotransferase